MAGPHRCYCDLDITIAQPGTDHQIMVVQLVMTLTSVAVDMEPDCGSGENDDQKGEHKSRDNDTIAHVTHTWVTNI